MERMERSMRNGAGVSMRCEDGGGLVRHFLPWWLEPAYVRRARDGGSDERGRVDVGWAAWAQ